LGFLLFWTPIFSFADLQLRWGLRKSYNPHWELSNDMWHATYMHIIQGNSWLLVVRNQIDILIPGLSFAHNLCCKCSNGPCELISDYVLRAFQWYKKVFNTMSFDPSNRSFKIWDFIGTPIPKMGVHLGVCELIPSHSFSFPRMWMWLSSYIFDLHLSKPLLWSRAES